MLNVVCTVFLLGRSSRGPLAIQASRKRVVIGSDLEVWCALPGYQNTAHRVRWYKLGGRMPTSSRIIGNMLKLSNIQPSHRGIYRCRVETPYETLHADYVVDMVAAG